MFICPTGKLSTQIRFPVEVYNTLGAGDAFASGFIYGHLKDWGLGTVRPLGQCDRRDCRHSARLRQLYADNGRSRGFCQGKRWLVIGCSSLKPIVIKRHSPPPNAVRKSYRNSSARSRSSLSVHLSGIAPGMRLPILIWLLKGLSSEACWEAEAALETIMPPWLSGPSVTFGISSRINPQTHPGRETDG